MSGRNPRKDELELWRKVAKQANPLHRDPPAKAKTKADIPKRPKQREETGFSLAPFEMSGAPPAPRDDLAPTLSNSLSSQPVAMDQKTFRNMRRGRLKPDARIDLHGMTADRAHSALTGFVMRAHASGHRLLLVITGKGKPRDQAGPIPIRLGVLRHQVPEWLRLPPLAPLVLQVTQAHISQGGEGAYYVYLRKPGVRRTGTRAT